MSNTAHSFIMSISKTFIGAFSALVVGLVAFGMTFSFSFAAFTTEERASLEASGFTSSQIDLLELLFGSTTTTTTTTSCGTTTESVSTGYVHSTTLMSGSNGAQVVALQNALNLANAAGLVADGAFGTATNAAVRAFQAGAGLGVDGIVGPTTGSAMASYTTSVTTTCEEEEGETSTGGTSVSGEFEFDGSEGSVDSYDLASPEENEALEGEDDVEIYAIEVEVDDEGHLLLDRMDIWFSNNNGAGSETDPWDYFESISLWVDGDKVAEENADSSSDWSDDENGNIAAVGTDEEYSMRFSALDIVLPADETTRISVAVTMQGTIDSDDLDAVWWVEVDDDSGFKLTDGTGFSFEDGAGEEVLEDNFDLDEEEMSGIEITLASDNPDETVIEVDKSSDTNGVEIAIFNVEETEGLDATIDAIEVEFTIVDPAGGINPAGAGTVMRKAYLFVDGDEIGSESVPATADAVTVEFDNLDWNLSGDDDKDVSVVVDFDDTNTATRYDNGTTVQVSSFEITELEDENGNDENDITLLTTTAVGEIHEVRSEGIMVELVSVSETITTAGDPGTSPSYDVGSFKVTFEATAFGEDQRIDRSAVSPAAEVAGEGIGYTLSAGTLVTASLTSSSTDSEDTVATFELDENVTRTFTLTVVVEGDDNLVELSVDSINYGLAILDTNAVFYTFNLDEFKTDELYLNAF